MEWGEGGELSKGIGILRTEEREVISSNVNIKVVWITYQGCYNR